MKITFNLPIFLPWVVLGLGLIFNLLTWHYANTGEWLRAQDRFMTEISEHLTTIHNRMNTYEQTLRAGVAFFNSSDSVERHEWKAFSESLKVKQNFPGIQGFGFTIFVKPENLDEHIAQIRSEGFPEYHIHPVGKRELYSTIIYLEPFDKRNQQAFGYDMWQQVTRRAAMERARDTGQPALSGRVTLVQEIDEQVQAGTLLYIPVYTKNVKLNTVEQRRDAIIGFVYAPFRMDDLMHGILGQQEHLIDLHIFDGDTTNDDALMYDSDSILHREESTEFRRIEQIDIAGRRWTIELLSTKEFDSTIDSDKPNLIGLGGIVMSFLLFGLVRTLAHSHKDAVQLATEMTAELTTAKEVAEAANIAKSGFLAKITHELKTPLTSIISLIQSLAVKASEGYSLTTRDTGSIVRIQKNAQQLLAQIQDILDMSRIEAGQIVLSREPTCLEELIRDVIGTIVAPPEITFVLNLGCRHNCDSSHRERESLDRHRIRQVLTNLISNAIKFTQKGNITISSESNEEGVTVFITDTGIGIPINRHTAIFAEFSQADDSITRRFGGSGLGLTIARRIVEMHGGKMWLEKSEEGIGSTFAFYIPTKQDISKEQSHA